jgi:hypothetical protein
MDRARQLSAEFVASGDPTGWFDQLYTEGQAGTSVIPWARGVPNESLVEWAASRQPGEGPWSSAAGPEGRGVPGERGLRRDRV